MLNKDTKYLQQQLATYCRTGEEVEINGVKTDRLHNYRRLVSNIIEDALQSAYPITYAALCEEHWDELIDDFIRIYKPSNPQLWKMPFDLYDFVLESNYHEKIQKPYLPDLILFEWMEIQVHTMSDLPINDFLPFDGAANKKIVVNPHFEALHLEYPVFKVKADDNIPKKGNYIVIVYRQLETGVVHFIELSPFLYAVFLRVTAEFTLVDALYEALKENQLQFEASMLDKIVHFITSLQEKGLVLGRLK